MQRDNTDPDNKVAGKGEATQVETPEAKQVAEEKAAKDKVAKEKHDAEETVRRAEEKHDQERIAKKYNDEMALREKGWAEQFEFQEYVARADPETGKVTGEFQQINPLTPEQTPAGTEPIFTLGPEMSKVLPNNKVYASKSDTQYKARVDENGGTKPVDTDRFSMWKPFDHKKYCNHVYSIHDAKADGVVTFDWDDIKNITEQKIIDNIKAATKHGVKVELGPNAKNFMKSNIIYKFDSATGNLEAKNIGIEEGEKSRALIDALLKVNGNEADVKQEKKKKYLDPLEASKYQTQNENNLKDLVHAEKDKEITKKIADLNSITDFSKPDNQKLVFDKTTEILNDIEKRLEKIETIEKRLNEEKKFYESQEAKIDSLVASGDRETLENVRNLLPGSHSQKTTDREALIAELQKERINLMTKRDVIDDKFKELKKHHTEHPEATPADQKVITDRFQAIDKQKEDMDKRFKEVEDKIKTLDDPKNKKEYKDKMDNLKLEINMKLSNIPKAQSR
jgi:hypothetical protein